VCFNIFRVVGFIYKIETQSFAHLISSFTPNYTGFIDSIQQNKTDINTSKILYPPKIPPNSDPPKKNSTSGHFALSVFVYEKRKNKCGVISPVFYFCWFIIQIDQK
jgi:hypothetical protein